MMPGPHINQLPAAGADAPHPAVFSRFGVLHVPSNTSPRLLEERHLAALATNPGEIGGLENPLRFADKLGATHLVNNSFLGVTDGVRVP